MKLDVKPGKYILAVSGGVDSMTLLNMLSNLPGIELFVAHFDHGIRPGSKADGEFVAVISKKMNLPFEIGYGKLGSGASEEVARNARYSFLETVRNKHG